MCHNRWRFKNRFIFGACSCNRIKVFKTGEKNENSILYFFFKTGSLNNTEDNSIFKTASKLQQTQCSIYLVYR